MHPCITLPLQGHLVVHSFLQKFFSVPVRYEIMILWYVLIETLGNGPSILITERMMCKRLNCFHNWSVVYTAAFCCSNKPEVRNPTFLLMRKPQVYIAAVDSILQLDNQLAKHCTYVLQTSVGT